MIQELKRTPITFDGVDGWEVLVRDDEIKLNETCACFQCKYVVWDWMSLTGATCDGNHDCLDSNQMYFRFEPK